MDSSLNEYKTVTKISTAQDVADNLSAQVFRKIENVDAGHSAQLHENYELGQKNGLCESGTTDIKFDIVIKQDKNPPVLDSKPLIDESLFAQVILAPVFEGSKYSPTQSVSLPDIKLSINDTEFAEGKLFIKSERLVVPCPPHQTTK